MSSYSLESERLRQRLWSLLGGPPLSRQPSIISRQIAGQAVEGAVVEDLLLDLNGIEPVPALFLRPRAVERPPLVLYAHAHGNNYDMGRNELVTGRPALQQPAYGHALVERGYAVLAIDNWLFGDRPRHGGENAFAKGRLLGGDTVFGMMLRDNQAALTLAVSELDVDSDRVAVMGLSMGASIAWWLTALDERIRVCVDLCCMTDFETAIRTGGIDGHGLYYCVPGLLREFSTASINVLTVPRPHLSLNGRFDPLTPEAGLEAVGIRLGAAYAAAGAPDAWRMEVHDCGHVETPAMRLSALAFLRKWL
ncbi:MAG: hypothetical protein K5872_19770 [Rhizobiaceae bacterium]|nr:hypothetical protein [Rhizobiaceae bacterium]MCV0408460.1 hypothetical protein [Rhizobiaceae bacterium]